MGLSREFWVKEYLFTYLFKNPIKLHLSVIEFDVRQFKELMFVNLEYKFVKVIWITHLSQDVRKVL